MKNFNAEILKPIDTNRVIAKSPVKNDKANQSGKKNQKQKQGKQQSDLHIMGSDNKENAASEKKVGVIASKSMI